MRVQSLAWRRGQLEGGAPAWAPEPCRPVPGALHPRFAQAQPPPSPRPQPPPGPASGKPQGTSSRKLASLSCPWPGGRRVSRARWGTWGQTSLGSGRGHIPAFLACGEGVPRSAEEAWPAARGESPWRFLLGRTHGNSNDRKCPPSWPSLRPGLGVASPPGSRPDKAAPESSAPALLDAASSGAAEPAPPPTVPASHPTVLGSSVRALPGLSPSPREDTWARDPSGSGGRRVMRQGGDMATQPRASLVPCGGDEITLPAGEPAPGAVGTSGRAHTRPHPPGPAALGLGAASPGDTATLLAVGRRGFRYLL